MPWEAGHPIKRDGTSRRQRLPRALLPENVPIDDRREEDLLLFLYKLADQFIYYNDRNEPDGNWQPFFAELESADGKVTLPSIRNYLQRSEGRRDNSVFLSLLRAFLHLYGYLQMDINALGKKQLEFYCEQVLGFRRRPMRLDEVHVVFQLAKQAHRHRIPAGTALKAGKDSAGKPLTYVIQEDIVVNKAQIAAIKSVVTEPGGRIYYAEMADSTDGLGAPLEGEPGLWPLFGDPAFMQYRKVTVGFAVASPLLRLQEGQRTITLTLHFDAPLPNTLSGRLFQHFIPYASGEEDWIRLELENAGAVLAADRRSAKFSIKARPATPPIVGYDPEQLSGRLQTRFPVLQLLLNPEAPHYDQLKTLKFSSLNLQVEVSTGEYSGVKDLVLQNDRGPLDGSQSFLPFGAEPTRGSLFYIGSREVFSKPLEKLTIRLQWADLPTDDEGNVSDFGDHYAQYPSRYQDSRNYTVRIEALNNGFWTPFSGPGASRALFGFPPDAPGSATISIDNPNTGKLLPELLVFSELSADLTQGFIRLRLNQDFGHDRYPRLFADVAGNPPPTNGRGEPPRKTFPNPPYTPRLEAISLGYKASLQADASASADQVQFFHVEPFGSQARAIGGGTPCLPTLPRAGFYLGLTDFEPPQNLHLLFQMAEGTNSSPDIIRREDIEWRYLTPAGWSEPLGDGQILKDTTLGLQKPGLLVFNIGRDAGAEHSLLPGGLHWLHANTRKDPAGAARCIKIHTQASSAVWRDQGNAANHLEQPLPAESISALVQRESEIKKVMQPYPSFGGAPAEQDTPFYTRISERLRHRKRAVTIWDLERLVLERFPEVYKVKAIPHAGFNRDHFYSEFQPGKVMLAVIPQLRRGQGENLLRPQPPAALLEEIRHYVAPLSTRLVGRRADALHIIAPHYEPLLLSFSVGFHEGYDGGYHLELLNEALRRRLSPWAYEASADIAFGNHIYKSQLLAFVEEQEYVDYVTDFRLFHGNTGPGIGEMAIEIDQIVYGEVIGIEVEEAVASTARSILVSAKKHRIKLLRPDEYPCDEAQVCQEGVGCWYVEIDLIVQ